MLPTSEHANSFRTTLGRWARHIVPLSLLLVVPAAWAQSGYLVRDIAPGLTPQAIAVSPSDLYTAGNRVFFFGSIGSFDQASEDYHTGLWVTDGTAAGTVPLAELCTAECTNQFVGAAGPIVFFLAGEDNADHLLWRTDGTRAGTFPLEPDVELPGFGLVHAFVGNTLYFTGRFKPQLWRTDGTAAGTALVIDLSAAPLTIDSPVVANLTAFAGQLYFTAPLLSDGFTTIWRSDGTPAGTVPFTALDGDEPGLLTAAGTSLFFLANYQLWVTDGTAAPHPVHTFTSPSPFTNTYWLAPVGNQVYLIVEDDANREQLWKSDGTTAGTNAVTNFTTEIYSFSESSIPSGVLAAAGDRVVFLAGGQGLTPGLWSTSGTLQSTVQLCAGACAANTSYTNLVTVGDRVVFFSGDTSDGYSLWGTDGTAAGTVQLTELCSGPTPCIEPPTLVPAASVVYFDVQTDPGGTLWQTDGTAAGTLPYAQGLLSQVPGLNDPLQGLQLAVLGHRLLFSRAEEGGDQELWVTDGTTAGTRQLTAIANPLSSDPNLFASLGDLVFFSATPSFQAPAGLWESRGTAATTVPVPGVTGSPTWPPIAMGGAVFVLTDQLWRTDGTAAGSLQLTSFPLHAASDVGPLVALQGNIFFPVFLGTDVLTLWKSDGTAQGTTAVVALASDIFPEEFAGPWVVGGYLFYVVDGQTGPELWRSDGTPAGTFQLAAVPYLVNPGLTAVGGRIYFVGSQGEDGAALWQTDGTVAGTAPVKLGTNLTGGTGASLGGLTAFGNALYYFVGMIPGSSGGLARTDGTAGGTRLIATFTDGFSLKGAPVPLGNQLFFALDDFVHGAELWVSDGTTAGTGLVRDINPGAAGSNPTGLVAAAGKLYFNADDGAHGPELWQCDGTAAGTRLVQDIWPGPAGANPSGMIQAGGLLYFNADDGVSGNELWALPLSGSTSCSTGPTTLCLLSDRFAVSAFWEDSKGNSGQGQAAQLTPDTGTFWFFAPDNVEVITKMVDGRALNDSFWFFYGALSNVEYWLTVTDTSTGAARRYTNPLGQLASVGDTSAFGPQGALSAPPVALPVQAMPGAPAAPSIMLTGNPATSSSPEIDAMPTAGAASCAPAAARLCLQSSRFAVSVTWRDFSGDTGKGMAVDLSDDTGYFWFFAASNVELVLKVLDGRPVNGKFWVFYGALSDVAYSITVTDKVTGSIRTYTNPAGQFASVADTAAF